LTPRYNNWHPRCSIHPGSQTPGVSYTRGVRLPSVTYNWGVRLPSVAYNRRVFSSKFICLDVFVKKIDFAKIFKFVHDSPVVCYNRGVRLPGVAYNPGVRLPGVQTTGEFDPPVYHTPGHLKSRFFPRIRIYMKKAFSTANQGSSSKIMSQIK